MPTSFARLLAAALIVGRYLAVTLTATSYLCRRCFRIEVESSCPAFSCHDMPKSDSTKRHTRRHGRRRKCATMNCYMDTTTRLLSPLVAHRATETTPSEVVTLVTVVAFGYPWLSGNIGFDKQVPLNYETHGIGIPNPQR